MEEVNKNTELNDTDKKLHISDVSDSYISLKEFDLAFDFLWGKDDMKEYVRKVIQHDDTSIFRIIRKYRDIK